MTINFSQRPILYKHSVGEQPFCSSLSHRCATEAVSLNTKYPRIYVLAMIPGQIADIFTRTARTFISPTASTIHSLREEWRNTTLHVEEALPHSDAPKSKVVIVLIGIVKLPLMVLGTPLFVALQIIIEVGHLLKVIFIVPFGLVNPKENTVFYKFSGSDRSTPRSVTISNRKSFFPESEETKAAVNEQLSKLEPTPTTKSTDTEKTQIPTSNLPKVLNTTAIPAELKRYQTFVNLMLQELFSSSSSLAEIAAATDTYKNKPKLFDRAKSCEKSIAGIDADVEGSTKTSYIDQLNLPKYQKYFSHFTDKFSKAFLNKIKAAQPNNQTASMGTMAFVNLKLQVSSILEEFSKITQACGKDSEFDRLISKIKEKYPILEGTINELLSTLSRPSKAEIT